MTESVGGPSAGSLRQAEIILHDQKEFHRRWGLATRKPGGAKATHDPGHRNIRRSRPRFRTCTGNTSWTRRCTPSTQCCPIRASASARRARSHGGWMHASMPAAAAIPSAKRFVRGPDVRIKSACWMALAPIDKPSSTGAATGNTTAASPCRRRTVSTTSLPPWSSARGSLSLPQASRTFRLQAAKACPSPERDLQERMRQVSQNR